MSDRLKEVIAELRKRQGTPSFIDRTFPKQCELLEDPSRFQAWNCTRRGAKSTSFAKRALRKLVNSPGSKGLYLALTLDSAREILWDVVEQQLTENFIPFKGYRREGIFRLDNGSQLRFFGVDGSYKEMKKILGQKQAIVGIDEAGSMTINMQELCYQMIQPALSDLQGDLIILGTCENIPNTFFERVLVGKDEFHTMWKKHIWTTHLNPYMAEIHVAEMERILEVNPLAAKASWFRTHYLNEWCADDDLLIIKFNSLINEVDKLPDFNDWLYGLGVDLGYNDATSFTVQAMSSKSPYLYTVESFKAPEMDLTDVANTIKALNDKYKVTWCEVDGANKQGVQEMQNRHDLGINLVSAEKTDKATFLRMFNDDYKQGKIKHIKSKCLPLELEQSQLMWIKDTDKEDPRCENHCNDGALYIWRKMRNYFKAEVSKWESEEQKMENQFKKESRERLNEESEMVFLF
jgi:hypothetical protein